MFFVIGRDILYQPQATYRFVKISPTFAILSPTNIDGQDTKLCESYTTKCPTKKSKFESSTAFLAPEDEQGRSDMAFSDRHLE